ncbi:chromo domain-containing protein LHP1-like, partial [Thalictrum thalictroides]
MKSVGAKKKSDTKLDEGETLLSLPQQPSTIDKGEENQEKDEEVYDREEDMEEEENNIREVPEQVEEERPKLDEGFYEIEDVRRKRIRKGQVQYLIKWRGWPETANTWEPIDNLLTCSDIIDAFELRSSKSSRKRKRKSSGISQNQPKKKQQQHSNSTSPATRPNDNGLHNSYSVPTHPPEDKIGTGKEANGAVDVEPLYPNHGVPNNVDTTDHLVEDGSTFINMEKNRNKETNEAHPNLNQPNLDDERSSIQVPDNRTFDKHGAADEELKAEFREMGRNRFTGAKRRKSGCVRRFKSDSISNGDETRYPIARTTLEPGQWSVQPDSLGDKARDVYNSENSVDPASIAKIIKPVSFCTSVVNNVQDVAVSFRAI